MARSRFDNLARDKQEVLLEAAALEFAAHGYQGASINRIIDQSGMSKGSVYYYFEDKADLFSTTFQRSIERIAEEAGWPVLDVVAADEYWDTLLELTRRSVEYAARNDWWIRLARSYHRLALENPDDGAVGRLLEWAEGWWRRIVVRGQELDLVRDDLPTDLLVAIAMGADQAGDRWMMDRWDDFTPDELERLVEARVDLVRDMLSKEHQGWDR
jgi:AcrR family transcriptional regulator